MKMHLKKVCCLAGLVLCTLFGAACGKIAPSSPAQTPSSAKIEASVPPSPTGEITVYLEALYADPLVHPPVLQAIEAFQKENPAITVHFVSPVGGVHDFSAREAEITRLNTEILSGKGPDLFLFGSRFTDCNLFPDLEKAMRNGAFLACNELLQKYKIDCSGENFWQPVMQVGAIEQAQYIVPLSFHIPAALGDCRVIQSSGFNEDAAGLSTSAFFSECARVYDQHPALTTYLNEPLTEFIACAPLNYCTHQVQLRGCAEPLEVNRKVWNEACWQQGVSDFISETQSLGLEGYWRNEAARLSQGKRLMDVAELSYLLDPARLMHQSEIELKFLPVPNESGGVTACIGSFAAINANAKNADAAAALLAFLLDAENQGHNAYPCLMPELPVRKGCIGASLQSAYDFKKGIWWLNPTEEEKQLFAQETGAPFEEKTPEEKANYLENLGQPLPQECAEDLNNICQKINAAHLQSIWYDSISSDPNSSGDDFIKKAYESYMNSELSIEQLIESLEPRLQLYLDE